MKTQPGVHEKIMKQMLKEGEEILDDSYLTTKEGRKILDLGCRILQECGRLRESRDNKISKADARKLAIKAFKFGQEKHEAKYEVIKLWVEDEMMELKK